MDKKEVLTKFAEIIGAEPVCVNDSFYKYEFKDDGKRKCMDYTQKINDEFGFDAKGGSACFWDCFSEFKFTQNKHGFKLVVVIKGVN